MYKFVTSMVPCSLDMQQCAMHNGQRCEFAYLCVCQSVYVCIYVCMCLNLYAYVFMYMCMYVSSVCVFLYMYVNVYVWICM